MKTALNYVAILMLIVTGALAFAEKPVQVWKSPMAAAKHDKNIARNLRSYESEGYVLVNEVENAFRYAVPPTGDYVWGECVLTLRHDAGEYYVSVKLTATVDYKVNEDGYLCTRFELLEEAIY